MDTIFALASARGKAGVAVIRLSGPQAHSVGRSLAGSLPDARQSALRRLRDPITGVLDDALVLRFDKGASFTGEDVVEFHLHGSAAIISAVLKFLAAQEGLRLAEAGEFTRRALENGCLDLAQVEGLGDLIEAETEAQRKQAQRVFEGALGKKAENWRRDLVRAMALIEATIDFADEDVPVDVTPEVLGLVDNALDSLKAEADGARISERIREGFEVAIVGLPNVGKSTLLNRLAGREAALTSEVAGTTRDVIEVRMDLGGIPVTLLDTAGLRETQDIVETLGIDRAISRAKQADIRVFLVTEAGTEPLGLTPQADDIIALGKGDLSNTRNGVLAVSGKTGSGVDALVSRIQDVLEKRTTGAATATRLRHRLAIEGAITHLESARLGVLGGPERAEFVAADLLSAVRRLDSLVGRVDVEHLLDEIFANFCIGK